MREDGDSPVRLPKWFLGTLSGALILLATGTVSWAVNVDKTQRALLQDVSSLQENREHVCDSLKRIEDKVDRLLVFRGDNPSP